MWFAGCLVTFWLLLFLGLLGFLGLFVSLGLLLGHFLGVVFGTFEFRVE